MRASVLIICRHGRTHRFSESTDDAAHNTTDRMQSEHDTPCQNTCIGHLVCVTITIGHHRHRFEARLHNPILFAASLAPHCVTSGQSQREVHTITWITFLHSVVAVNGMNENNIDMFNKETQLQPHCSCRIT